MSQRERSYRKPPQMKICDRALLGDAWRFLLLCLRPSAALAAEHLFLRKKLALYQERHMQPRRATNAIRIALIWLARWFDWRQALAMV
jgi:hypothetical protein